MLKIRELTIDGSLVLAPMAGFCDSPFRRIARRHGACLVFTELISAEGIIRGSRKTMELMRFAAEERPLGIQIFGKDPVVMGEAAAIVERELAPDLIDINAGCCAPKVCSGGSGAALLRNPVLLGSIAASVVRSVKTPVTAKIRIGWDERSRNYLEVVRVLEDSGVSLISVHGRTRSQKYGETADWNVLAEIKMKAKVPVIGNGDIKSHDEALSRLASSGCDAVMIGRGAVGNPWVFSGREPDITGIVAGIKEHLGMMIDLYGEPGIVLMRKHLVRYIHGMRNASRVRAALVVSKSREELCSLLDSLA
jgi:nifR3 family TIM-barrel protein